MAFDLRLFLRAARLAAASALVLACGGHGAKAGSTNIKTAASNGTLTPTFELTLSGTGSASIGQVSLVHNVGTLAYGGHDVPVVAFQTFTVPYSPDTVFVLLAVDHSRWITAYAYCAGGELHRFWAETTDGKAGRFENATGSCTSASAAMPTPVHIDASELPPPTLSKGFTMTGSNLNYDGTTPGSATFAGATWTFYPYDFVDCSGGCGGTPNWELHALFTDAATGRTCVGALYLPTTVTNTVGLSNLFCLPTLEDPNHGTPVSFAATSTHP
jgi:hypothetical protein